MHTIKETDMLAAKLDLLLKKIDEGNRPQMPVPVHAMNSYYTCEVYGDCGHSGKLNGHIMFWARIYTHVLAATMPIHS